MTDATGTPQDTHEPEPTEVIDAGGDDFLRVLASLAHAGIGTSVTVAVPGSVISGVICSRNRWLDLLADQHGGAPAAEMFVNALRDRLRTPDDQDEESVPASDYHYLHLENAAVQAGNTFTARGMLWRVRISEVSAWTFSPLAAP